MKVSLIIVFFHNQIIRKKYITIKYGPYMINVRFFIEKSMIIHFKKKRETVVEQPGSLRTGTHLGQREPAATAQQFVRRVLRGAWRDPAGAGPR